MKRFERKYRIAGVAAAVVLLPLSSALSQEISSEYEWDPSWGLHEEEWYDPSDWFNDDNVVDIEDTYTSDYYTGDFWLYDDYVYDHGYAYDFVDDDIDYYYQWDPVLVEWRLVEGTEEASRTAANEAKQRESRETSADDQREQQVAAAEDVITMRGTVVNIARIRPQGSDREHTFVRLDVSNERSVLVDMGPQADTDNMNIKKGKQIQVRGTRTEFGDGRYVLVAQQVSEAPPGQQYGGRSSTKQDEKKGQHSDAQEKKQSSGKSSTEQPESSNR